MTYVEIAVGLGREACLQPTVVFAFFQVVVNDLLNKVHSFLDLVRVLVVRTHTLAVKCE